MKLIPSGIALALALTAPFFASAHEVYVLPPEAIEAGMNSSGFSMMNVVFSNMEQFLFWAFIGVLIVFCVFFISVSRKLEDLLDPILARTKKYAPLVARWTMSFFAAAYYQAIFGPELPLTEVFGSFAPLATAALILSGILIISHRYVRAGALIALGLFLATLYKNGSYMLTYTNYFAEIIALSIAGAAPQGALTTWKRKLLAVRNAFAPYRFVVLRVGFGISLLYASIYAKFLHNDLALQVATNYGLTQYLHFEPHFLVLGAGIVEVVIGLFFLLGIEIRFTALFLEFWLTLSLLYFGEVVWPHFILIGIPIAFFLYGYDKYSVEGMFFKKGDHEPVL